jgi:hypothetical protein
VNPTIEEIEAAIAKYEAAARDTMDNDAAGMAAWFAFTRAQATMFRCVMVGLATGEPTPAAAERACLVAKEALDRAQIDATTRKRRLENAEDSVRFLLKQLAVLGKE